MSFRGQQDATAGNSEFNAQAFLVQQMLGRLNTSTLVEIMAVTNAGEISPVGYVDVRPLVNQLDGNSNAVPNGTIYGVPYFRLQGGANAIVIDPVVGDIGLAAFADHDISSVIANKAQANPGSLRRFSMADAMYLGGLLNGTPEQYVQFSAAGIKLLSPTAIIIQAPDIQMIAPTISMEAATSITATTPLFTINGDVLLNGGISQGAGGSGSAVSLIGPVDIDNDLVAAGKSVSTHDHNVVGVQTGGSTLTTTDPN